MNLDQLARDAGAEVRDRVATIEAPTPGAIARRSRRGRLATGVAAIAVLAFGGVGLAVALQDDPAPTRLDVTHDPDAAVADFPNLTTTFVSPRNGFSVDHPDRVALTPAEQLWGFVDDGFDVLETGLAAVFKGASTEFSLVVSPTEFPDGISIDERVDEYLEGFLLGGCGVPRSQQAEITIDGQSGRIAECPNHIEATVVAGGRLYLFTLSHHRRDARAVFDAFAATIDLTPETAVDFPGLTTTFVSPTYGYSFGWIDRGGGLWPATELWDPVNQQPISNADSPFSNPDNPFGRFDYVETGFGADFQAGSTEIPEGVSIDELVDEYVSPSGCGRPRSQQEEITIDGQPGRIFECPSPTDRILATVVASGRLYLFTMLHHRTDAREFFDTWVATIDLRPEAAAEP